MASFPDHFSAVAASYARYRPRYPAALFDFLLTLVSPKGLVWDCAAGSGQATKELAARFARVVATDASAAQLAAAPLLPNVEYRVALAEDSGLPEASFDLVTVAQALHWFDLERFYAEVRRVAKPHAILAAWCYDTCTIEGEEADLVMRHFYEETLGPFWPANRRLVEDRYRTIPFPFEELPAPQLAMEERWTLPELLGYVATWSARQRSLAEAGHDPLPAFAEALAAAWGDPHRPRRVRWALALRVGRIP